MQPSLGPTPAGHHRWGDFIALPEDDPRELVDGQLLEIEVPTFLHEWIVATLIFHLQSWSRAHRAGVVVGSGYKLFVSEQRGVMPDLQYYRSGRRPPDPGLHGAAPDMVVEVISPTSSRYDRVEKLNWYAEIGVPEYWIVDPDARTLEQLLLEADGYRVASALAADDTFRPSTFAGLEIPLRELWDVPAQ